MNDNQIVNSSFTAGVNAPLGKIDIPAWCFNLPEREYNACSPAHVSAGFTTAPDGKRMSINVEIIGGSLIVQHYVETLAYHIVGIDLHRCAAQQYCLSDVAVGPSGHFAAAQQSVAFGGQSRHRVSHVGISLAP